MRLIVTIVAVGLLVPAALAGGSNPIHGKISGQFGSASGCFGCGDMVTYIKADRVWCAWQGENVIIHVRFRNTSVERLAITWHPSYVIRNGGAHGEGLTSLQDVTVGGRASRGAYAKQDPKGVPTGSPLSICKPSFYMVKSSD